MASLAYQKTAAGVLVTPVEFGRAETDMYFGGLHVIRLGRVHRRDDQLLTDHAQLELPRPPPPPARGDPRRNLKLPRGSTVRLEGACGTRPTERTGKK